ncbi:hypothetical protein EUGRSUZ_L03681 [Eucalyptus grandis]|uniref:beta-ketoacyl-[acyl-carrier-protein] synthase I n=1 Tax=Eucalyptus grandis TaxID=71139 RepID=A0AAD9T7N4_EUCGR|nr:hypothetical protein EUGRSUZ_L03681 [Eucalyptus grandis]KAK2630940.1 hypothetical protein EUGRSUZ_L03681 [Eucalyptus grandis]
MAGPSRRMLLSPPLSRCIRRISSSPEPFEPPPAVTPRRVVVTGLGMVTPLGCGVETTWKRLIDGECGIRAITPEDLKMDNFDGETRLHTFQQLTSKVAATVPRGTNRGEFNEELWLNSKEHRSIARFIGYALCAADEALRDANWLPTEQEQKEMTNARGFLLEGELEASVTYWMQHK